MPDVLERINLNVPRRVREQLRELAGREGRTESEVARTLLIDALERARRDAFYRRVAEHQTPAMRTRELELLRAFDSLDG
jgi:hypothetical protein